MPDPPAQDRTPDRPSDADVLDDGQEEVFSRAEVELGVTEHCSEAGSHSPRPVSEPT